MKLPQVLTALIQAQDDFDSHAYANCFSEHMSYKCSFPASIDKKA